MEENKFVKEAIESLISVNKKEELVKEYKRKEHLDESYKILDEKLSFLQTLKGEQWKEIATYVEELQKKFVEKLKQLQLYNDYLELNAFGQLLAFANGKQQQQK